jgi:hypothetical protein
MGHDISAYKISTPVANYRRNAETDTDIYNFLNVQEFNEGVSGDGREIFSEVDIRDALTKAKAAGAKHADTVEFLETCLENLNDQDQILITFD